MGPANTPHHKVEVWYEVRGVRKFKVFDNPYEARVFYARKFNMGKRPEVKKHEPKPA